MHKIFADKRDSILEISTHIWMMKSIPVCVQSEQPDLPEYLNWEDSILKSMSQNVDLTPYLNLYV